MGSVSAMSSIGRVLEAHEDEISQQYMDMVPESLKPHITAVTLTNNVHNIEVSYVCADGSHLPGPSIDIDQLADDYPDCEVAY